MSKAIETVPALELTPQAIDHLVEELRAYHAIYSPLFQRREQREWAQQYLHGLLLDLPRKSVEPMVLALNGVDAKAVRTMPWFISDGAWADEPLLQRHWPEVDQTLGAAEGVLTLDGSDFLEQGQESVGVKRQYCGEVGKRANCQAGVFLGYASRKGYTLLDRHLYLPEEWVEAAAYAARRQRCGVPPDIPFKTKPQLGWEMIQAVPQAGTLRCRWVTCDEAFGRDTAFLDRVAELGLWYMAAVPHDAQVWRQRPATAVPAWSGHGRKPTRTRVLAGEATPEEVAQVAAALPARGWVRRTIKEGSKGPLVARFAVLRVIAVREGLPGPEVWLVLRRNVLTGELKTYLCNAPVAPPLARLVRLSGMRWPIETFYQDGKGHLGFNEYRMRSAEAIGKHWCLVFVAYSLLHLTCLPAGPDRTKGLMQTIGDACRHQGRALLQNLLLFVHEQLSGGAAADHVFAQLFAKQGGMVLV